MAAFTSALLLGAGLAGGFAASKLKKKPAPTLAPGPVAPSAITAPTPPVIDPGANQAAAVQAGQKQRKKAAAGSLLTNPTSNATPVLGKAVPRSLLGS